MHMLYTITQKNKNMLFFNKGVSMYTPQFAIHTLNISFLLNLKFHIYIFIFPQNALIFYFH